MASSGRCVSVRFDGVLESSLRAGLTRELIKFILFQRQQIPMPFDHIKDDHEAEQDRRGETLQQQRLKQMLRSRGLRRQRAALVDAMSSIFSALDDAFTSPTPLKQVLLLLGATAVSPREAFLLTFPSALLEGHPLSLRTALSSLFRCLIQHDWLGDVAPLRSPTRLHVLLQAPTTSGPAHGKLLARPHFRFPSRSRLFVLNVLCTGQATSAELSLNGPDVEISGIEVLESSDEKDDQPSSPKLVPLNTPGKKEEDLMWYQVPVSAKGYKDREGQKNLFGDKPLIP